jgi:hypothetical protein
MSSFDSLKGVDTVPKMWRRVTPIAQLPPSERLRLFIVTILLSLAQDDADQRAALGGAGVGGEGRIGEASLSSAFPQEAEDRGLREEFLQRSRSRTLSDVLQKMQELFPDINQAETSSSSSAVLGSWNLHQPMQVLLQGFQSPGQLCEYLRLPWRFIAELRIRLEDALQHLTALLTGDFGPEVRGGKRCGPRASSLRSVWEEFRSTAGGNALFAVTMVPWIRCTGNHDLFGQGAYGAVHKADSLGNSDSKCDLAVKEVIPSAGMTEEKLLTNLLHETCQIPRAANLVSLQYISHFSSTRKAEIVMAAAGVKSLQYTPTTFTALHRLSGAGPAARPSTHRTEQGRWLPSGLEAG